MVCLTITLLVTCIKKDQYCDLCSESFFSVEGVRTHKVNAHNVLLNINDDRVKEEVIQIAGSIEKKNMTVDLTVMDSDSAQVISSDKEKETGKNEDTVKTDETPVKTDETPQKEPVKSKDPFKTDEAPVKDDALVKTKLL